MIFGFYEGLLNSALICGIIFYITAFLMRKYKPKWPNLYYGYRTPRSLKNKESFDAGNEYSGKLMHKLAVLLILAGLGFALFYYERYWLLYLVVAVAMVMISTIYLIFSTENFLKRKFPTSGNCCINIRCEKT